MSDYDDVVDAVVVGRACVLIAVTGLAETPDYRYLSL